MHGTNLEAKKKKKDKRVCVCNRSLRTKEKKETMRTCVASEWYRVVSSGDTWRKIHMRLLGLGFRTATGITRGAEFHSRQVLTHRGVLRF